MMHTLLFLLVCLISLSTVESQSEDFEFDDKFSFRDEHTFIDDEDLMNDEPGSGVGGVPDMEGSGTDGETTELPVYPSYKPSPGGEGGEGPFRATINFTSLYYQPELGDRNSANFTQMAEFCNGIIESIFEEIPGTQTVNTLQFRPGTMDPSIKPTLMVTFDLTTQDYYNSMILFNTLNYQVNTGKILSYDVTAQGFDFRDLSEPSATRPPAVPCQRYEWQCRDGACIDERRHCDGSLDCADRSDEYDCEDSPRCGPEDFTCNDGECIPDYLRCNDRYDCADRSDESDCPPPECTGDQFTCSDGQCLESYQVCDGIGDCVTSEDEADCDPATQPPPRCNFGEFECDGRCHSFLRKCDRYADCADGSDEIGCSGNGCDFGQFECRNGKCILELRRCDEFNDCGDGSDEEECGDNGACAMGEFQCANGACILASGRCDGYDECEDGSDEFDCIGSVERCDDTLFTCDNGNCVDPRYRCDDQDNCGDNSDEADCEEPTPCTNYEFACDNGNCIDPLLKCNGQNNCGDGSDERDCDDGSGEPIDPFECAPNQFVCGSGECIDEYLRCNRRYDCSDLSDEMNCPAPGECRADQFRCDNGQCIAANRRCDRTVDCGDGSDESNCQNIPDLPASVRVKVGGADQVCFEVQNPRDDGGSSITKYSVDYGRNLREEFGVSPRENVHEFCLYDLISNTEYTFYIRAGNDVGYSEAYTFLYRSEVATTIGAVINLRPTIGRDPDTFRINWDAPRDIESTDIREYEIKYRQVLVQRDIEPFYLERPLGDYITIYLAGNEIGWDEFAPYYAYLLTGLNPNAHYQVQVLYRTVVGWSEANDLYIFRTGAGGLPPAAVIRLQPVIGIFPDTFVLNWELEDPFSSGDITEYTIKYRRVSVIEDREPFILDRTYEDFLTLYLFPDQISVTADYPVYSYEIKGLLPNSHYQIELRYREDGELSEPNENYIVRTAAAPVSRPLDAVIRLSPTIGGNSDIFRFNWEAPSTVLWTDITSYEIKYRLVAVLRDVEPFYLDRPYEEYSVIYASPEDIDVAADYPAMSYLLTGLRPESHYQIELRYKTVGDWSEPNDVYIIKTAADLDIGCASDEFECNSGQCVYANYKCDGRTDCQDGSDEVGCPSPITVTVTPSTLRVREGEEAVFQCRSSGGVERPPVVRWSMGNQQVPVGASEVDGRLTFARTTMTMSGEYTCRAIGIPGSYEAYARLDVIPFGPTDGPPSPGKCGLNEATCQSGQCIPRDYLCDGDFDCNDRSDEANCVNPLPCEPNEMQCDTGTCIMKMWRCDGDDDCGDGSDERDCATANPGDLCHAFEYMCLAGDQCIPASYQCDGEVDCQDRSDEIGCAKPTVTRPPPASVEAREGETITITCSAIGVPTPLIVWRLNWGHIGAPPRIFTTTENGYGVLTIRDAKPEDEGAYTCEAISTMGTIFAIPDAIVTLLPPDGICQRPYFNDAAFSQSDCLRCFCFEHSDQCQSSKLFKSQIYIGNTLPLTTRDNQEQEQFTRLIQFLPNTRTFSIREYSRRVFGGDFYWSLPVQFLGNKVTSYGGELTFTIFYDVTGSSSRLTQAPDLIMAGNGRKIYSTYFTRAFAGTEVNAAIPLREDAWSSEEGRQSAVSREAFLTVLQNLDYILIKSNYDNSQSDVSISNIHMTTAGNQDMNEGVAVLVEQCLSCPVGYTGTSCEECAPGFSRQPGGRYLGQCVSCNCNGHASQCDPITGACIGCQHNTVGDRCDRCATGFYGDARNGRPDDCQTCPCPFTDGRQVLVPSGECYLDDRRQVVCLSCPQGYEGQQCERCASGYEGNPANPGEYCRPQRNQCDSRGSLSSYPDPATGRCQCRRNTEGSDCSECVANTFYLADENQFGCIDCFCMSITKRCSSSTWNRAQISTSFTRDAQGFSLTDFMRTLTYSEGLSTDTFNRELTLRDLSKLPADDVYYWILPSRYINNKITAYGGNLKFSTKFIPGFDTSSNSYPDVEIAGNDYRLQYYHNTPARSDVLTPFTVPLYEQYWQRTDGMQPSREHMMMALADIKYIIIKATYTTDTREVSIKDVSLDVAEDRRTGQGRAYTVEQCNCQQGYQGLSCEDCAPGYRRSGGGLYLGTCVPCDCNGHATQCDTDSGQCRGCLHNTEGERCDRCAAGYYGDATRGTRYDCKPCPCPLTEEPNQFSPTCYLDRDGDVTCNACPAGHTGRQCESCAPGYQGNPYVPGDYCKSATPLCQCNSRGTVPNTQCDPNTKQCTCKAYAQGQECDTCKPGYFHLSADNPQGCLACNCMGVTDQCFSSNYYRDQIRPVFDERGHNFGLTTRVLHEPITDGFIVDRVSNSIRFVEFGEIQKEGGTYSYYFALPPRFRGDHVASYGGSLKFTLQFSTALDIGELYRDTDVELVSGDKRFYHFFNPAPLVEEYNYYDIVLTEASFQTTDGSPSDRATFLAALANIDAFLIRATYHQNMAFARLQDISMDTAVPENTGQARASVVEQCRCPEGYTGLSCEQCATGYLRATDPSSSFGMCVRCDCNSHATSCDPNTGACIGCRDNTEGERCERCRAGYYGDATVGTRLDCRQCPCPLTISSNKFSPTCYLDNDGAPTCDACPPGYEGRNCERCASGFAGDPRQPGQYCERDSNGRTVVEVSPMRLSESEGATAVIRCRAQGRGQLSVTWIRADGKPLPEVRAVIEEDNTLVIRDVRQVDAGRYICSAYGQQGRDQDEATLSVYNNRGLQVIVEEPKRQTIGPGSSVTFTCNVRISQPIYVLAWTKLGGVLPVRAYDNGQGVLIIERVRPEDAGTYVCTGSTPQAVDTDEGILVVSGGADEAPTVRIEPRFIEVNVGDPVEMRCIATGRPAPQLEWRGGRNDELNPQHTFVNGVFRIPRVRKADEAEYRCIATNSAGSANVRTIIYVRGDDFVEPEFEVLIDQPDLTITPGGEARLGCQARTTVEIDDISWARQNVDLPIGAYTTDDGTLVIPNCRPIDAGRYICTITLVNGQSAQSVATLTIDTTTNNAAPTARIEPQRQDINQGMTATITCRVTGNPEPYVTWKRIGGDLGPNHRVQGNVLRIQEAMPEDRGLYVCEAENLGGRAQSHVILEVNRREMPVIAMYPSNEITIAPGSSALFQCRVTEGVPSPSVTWTRADGSPMTDNTEVFDENGVIQFITVTGAEQGAYICEARNEAGSVTSTAVLTIRGAPRVSIKPSGGRLYLRERDPLRLECVASGDPLPSLYWDIQGTGRDSPRGEFPAKEVGSALVEVRSVTVADSGTYTCVASNAEGRVEESVQVIVQSANEAAGGIDGGFQPVKPKTEYQVIGEGATVEMTCTGAADQSRIVWSRENEALPAQHIVRGGNLTIVGVRAEDSGTYICTSRTANFEYRGVIELTVEALPQVFITPQNQVIRSGESLRLECRVQGSGDFQVEWQKVSGQMSPAARDNRGVLTISPVTAADSGRYVCVARGSVGEARGFADISIIVAPTATVAPSRVELSVGDRVELQCITTGSPAPRVEWTKQGGRLPREHSVQGGILRIDYVEEADSGRYICEAENEAGRVVAYSYINVQRVLDLPEIPKMQQDAELGAKVEVYCESRGDEEVTWERLGYPDLPDSAQVIGSLLLFDGIRREDGGTYRCAVTNRVGVSYADVLVIIEEAPLVVIERQVKEVTLGTGYTLTCSQQGTPTPRFVWSKRGGDLPYDYEVNGGTLIIPSMRREDEGEYICTGTNKYGSAQSVVVLQIGSTVPYFVQNDRSYIRFPTLSDAYMTFDIEIAFRPESTDGLLLFNGEGQSGRDFISLGMSGGAMEFRFDTGAGPAIIRSARVPLNTWHVARIKRMKKDGMLVLDGEQYYGSTPGTFVGLGLNTPLYLGGVDRYDTLPRDTGFITGFVGCVSRMSIDGIDVPILEDAYDIVGTADCPTCPTTGRPCEHGGYCRSAATNYGYSCACQRGYSGRNCELIGEDCSTGSCSSQARCYNLENDLGYTCACPLGTYGPDCQQGRTLTVPFFNTSSYAAYPTIEDAVNDIIIEMEIKLKSLNDGIFLYNSKSNDGNDDFIALAMKDGRVEFSYNSGSGAAQLLSNEQLELGEWYTITAERHLRDGSLQINGGIAVKGRPEDSFIGYSPEGTIGLNLGAYLYIGGVDSRVRVAPVIQLDKGFVGCVSELKLNGREMELLDSVIESSDVAECGNDSPCDPNPCVNYGQCREDRFDKTAFRCQCQEGYSGERCEIEETICTTNNPCRNEAICEIDGYSFKCLCPLGYGGQVCDQDIYNYGESVAFRGDGFVEMEPRRTPRRQSTQEIVVTVSTQASDGIIYWQGQDPTVSGLNRDFVSIAVVDGRVQFSFELGSGPAEITSFKTIDDGEEHTITTTRTGTHGTLEVDNEYTEGHSQGRLESLEVQGNIFIGGVPDPVFMTGNRYQQGFTGCIKDLSIGRDGPVSFDFDVLGINVAKCSPSN